MTLCEAVAINRLNVACVLLGLDIVIHFTLQMLVITCLSKDHMDYSRDYSY